MPHSGFTAETDKILFNTISETLVKVTELPLPDDFLKRWLKDNDERPFTDEEIEKQYPGFADSMRWQMIENRIIRDHHIEVKDEDIRNYITHGAAAPDQYRSHGSRDGKTV